MKTYTTTLLVVIVAITNLVFASPKNPAPSQGHGSIQEQISKDGGLTLTGEFHNTAELFLIRPPIMIIQFHSAPIMATEQIRVILADVADALEKVGDIREEGGHSRLNSLIATFTPRLMKSGAKIVTINLPRLGITIALIPNKIAWPNALS